MPLRYLLQRIGAFILIVWAAATINFAVPRLASVDPVREQMLQAVAVGDPARNRWTKSSSPTTNGSPRPADLEAIRALSLRHGQIQLWVFDHPISHACVIDDHESLAVDHHSCHGLDADCIHAGESLRAILAWPRAPKFTRFLAPPILTFSAVPYYLLGLTLIYVLAFTWRFFSAGRRL